MIRKSINRRRITNKLLGTLAVFIGSDGLLILIWIIYEVFIRGIQAFSPSFFMDLPKPPGVEEESGLLNAILGSLIMTVLAVIFSTPLGILGGIYLSEFGKNSRFAGIIRYVLNIMKSTPTIILGIALYFVVVIPSGGFSGYAGAFALAIIMFPFVMEATEREMMRVPFELREAATALGASRSKTIWSVVLRGSRSSLITAGLFIAVRAAGETAPLIFTALNNTFMPGSLSKAYPSLTVTIYQYALSPFKEMQALAWGASLLLILFILIMAFVTRRSMIRRRT
jgi:phosphate transport system permease protein